MMNEKKSPANPFESLNQIPGLVQKNGEGLYLPRVQCNRATLSKHSIKYLG